MAQVNDLSSLALENAPHDIDGSVVSVEKTCRSNDADFIFRSI
jgi:hypothetical protein